MIYLFYIILIIAIYHFIYDGIFLPSIRLKYRDKLFALRDEIRWLKNEQLDDVDVNALKLIHDGINTLLTRLPMLSISLFNDIQKDLKNDAQLRDKVQSRIEIINKSQNENVQRIYKDMNKIVEYVFLYNSGGWFIYLIPIAIVKMFAEKILDLAQKIVVIPPNDVARLIPET